MNKAESRLPSRGKRYSFGIGGFAGLYLLFEHVSHVAIVVHAWEFLETLAPLLKRIPGVWAMASSAVLAALGSWILLRLYVRARLRNFELPEPWEPTLSKYAGDSRLRFRLANEPVEFKQLAETEDYGSWGETDIARAIRWWDVYDKGQFLMVYDGTIIGGIDLWPIRKTTYDAFLAGTVGDHTLEANHLSLRADPRSSYWYAGSISLSKVWVFGKARRELILRLLVNFIRFWLDQNPSFPARIVAVRATDAGDRLMDRLGFAPQRTAQGEGEIRVLELNSRADAERRLRELVRQIEPRNLRGGQGRPAVPPGIAVTA